MKISKSILLAPLAVLSLASCSLIKHRVKIEDYVIDYTQAENANKNISNKEINILQLSDIHMSVMDDADLHYRFIEKTLEYTERVLKDKVDLIVITGDVFTFSDRTTVKNLCNFFEGLHRPWTLVFGNHDEQGYYPIDWLTGYLTDLSNREHTNLLFKDFPNDDVFGSSNFVINFGKESGNRQLIMLDSNRYNYGEGYGYDYIHHDQIDWYLRAYNYFEEKADEGKHANSLAFFHIPVPEYIDAYADAFNHGTVPGSNSVFLDSTFHRFNGKGEEKTEKEERHYHEDSGEGAPGINTGFYEVVRKLGYTKGFFVGHDHTNTNCMDYRPADSDTTDNSVGLCFGIKSTDRVYCHDNWLGGQLIRFKATPDAGQEENRGSNWFSTDVILHNYSDLKEGK